MPKLEKPDGRSPRAAVLYHFMYPDDVVSAVLLDEFAQDLVSKGWDVEALPCNRGCRDETRTYSSRESFKGVHYRRVWRPGFSQRRFWGRLCNSAWMILAWSRLAFRPRNRRPDVVLIGTDPVFAAAVAIPLRLLARDIRLAHWCFDMHPEAAIAEGLLHERALPVRVTQAIMRRAYRSFDLIADLGNCMRTRLRRYGHAAAECELTPWALAEPSQPVAPDPIARRELFGAARIGVLYSGSFGEAHDHADFLALARALRDRTDVHFCFAMRGSRAEAFRQAVTPEDCNISFAGFAPVEELEKRLGSADIHLVSLKREWSGIAVPSKFFGSIAAGRPILFSGPPDSAIGGWIQEHELGWIIDPQDVSATARHIAGLADDTTELDRLQKHCHATYRRCFSREIVMESWDRELRGLFSR